MASILPLDQHLALHAAAAAVREGELIAFPSDIAYSVGGDLSQAGAVAALYALKGRQTEEILPVLLASAAQLARVAREVPEAVWRLVEAFWPGTLTIVVPRHPDVPDLVGGAGRTIGVRVPAHRGLLRLLETARVPLVSASAGGAGQPAARDAQEVDAALGRGLRLILDGGVLPAAPEATVIDMTAEVPTVLHEGDVTAAAIARVLGQNPLIAARR